MITTAVLTSPWEMESTIGASVRFAGVGVHSGKIGSIEISPAAAGHGIVFIDGNGNHIPALWSRVHESDCRTVLDGIETIEHIMAALLGAGIQNAKLSMHGNEVPILDGSCRDFYLKITKAGKRTCQKTKSKLVILQKVCLENNHGWVSLEPHENFALDVSYDAGQRMPKQNMEFDFSIDNFATIADARTLGFFEDAQKLWDMGLAQGSSLENTVVYKDGVVMNPEGLRDPLEPAKHKVLDAIGDLALAGYSICGKYSALNGGHYLNNQLLRKVFSDSKNYTIVC